MHRHRRLEAHKLGRHEFARRAWRILELLLDFLAGRLAQHRQQQPPAMIAHVAHRGGSLVRCHATQYLRGQFRRQLFQSAPRRCSVG